MSLRARLTLLYTFLVGGILLLFGIAVYQAVLIALVNQVDEILIKAYQDVLPVYERQASGVPEIVFPTSLDFASAVFFQFWGSNGELRQAWPNAAYLEKPLDPLNVQVDTPIFSSPYHGETHLRVLTIPLQIGGSPLGTLQVGTSLAVVDATQNLLLGVLLTATAIAMSLAGLAAWYTTNRALIPLETVTQTALQITQADDLSRRIPSYGLSKNDEIGQLITAFNQTLARLEQLFQTQRRFLTDVGHELRTPLTVIKGNLALMRRMGGSDDESLNSIDNEADRLTRLVGGLLILAQAESGKLPLDRRVIELDTLLFEIIQEMGILAEGRAKIRLGEIDQILVCGDRDRLKQVWVNLIGNALNYTPAGGEIVVSMSKVNNEARIAVNDSGPGIAEEDLPHIFERFYRGEKSRTRSKDGQGFGLGLPIAYWLVHHHGGKIEVTSKEGKGSTFTVWMPLADEHCQPVVNGLTPGGS